jgi:hypothetical protein
MELKKLKSAGGVRVAAARGVKIGCWFDTAIGAAF